MSSNSSSMSLVSRWQSWAPCFLSLLRIIAALMFMSSGTIKLFAYPMPMPEGMTTPLFSQVWFGGMLETIGGALLVLGLFTRPVAFILAGMMAVAYFQFHAPHGFWPVVNQGTDAVIYCFLWLYISAAGPGHFSLDRLLSRSRHTSAADQ